MVAFPLRLGHALIVFIHKKLKELILERDLHPQEAVQELGDAQLVIFVPCGYRIMIRRRGCTGGRGHWRRGGFSDGSCTGRVF